MASTTYTVDGGSSTRTPVRSPVTGVQDHTIAVTVTDNATNVGTATSTLHDPGHA